MLSMKPAAGCSIDSLPTQKLSGLSDGLRGETFNDKYRDIKKPNSNWA